MEFQTLLESEATSSSINQSTKAEKNPSNSQLVARLDSAAQREPELKLDPVESLLNLLGDKTVLLPLPKGTKAPNQTGWQNTRIEVMSDPKHISKLKTGNIGVLLGKNSDRLCSIDCDVDSEVEPFLSSNPKLRETLRTRGKRGCQIFVRIKGEYPPNAKIKKLNGSDWGDWRTDGGQSVVHGLHPDGVEYTILVKAKPIEIPFNEIVWSEDLIPPKLKTPKDHLIEQFGEPFIVGSSGAVKPNHLYFVERYKAQHPIIYDTEVGAFFEYNAKTGAWEERSEEALKNAIIEDLRGVAITGQKGLFPALTDKLSNELFRLLKSRCAKEDAFRDRPSAIHAANGMLVIKDGSVEIEEFHPSFLSQHPGRIAFDEKAQCPKFKAFLKQCLGDDDIILLQRYGGAVLMGTNPAQRFLLLTGTAGGGKSTIIKIIQAMLGEAKVAQLRTDHLLRNFETSAFIGKTFLYSPDVAADFLQKRGASMIKSIVGGDGLEAEIKGQNKRVRLNGNYNLAIVSNSKLIVHMEDDVEAWRRRMMIVDLTRAPVEKRDPHLVENLMKEEGAGIFRFFIDGAVAHKLELEKKGDYELTEAQRRRVDDLLAESESVKSFIRDCVVATAENEEMDITKEELQKGYADYCTDMGWEMMPEKQVQSGINRYMREIHHARESHSIRREFKDCRGYRNFKIRRKVS